MREPRPPRLAEAILSGLLPERDRAAIIGDMSEEYRARAAADGERAARRWYRRQVVRGMGPALARRTRRHRAQREEGRTMGRQKTTAERLGVSWLDVKLGLRMLRKRPVMTLAALFALMVGIPASMVPERVADALEAPIPEDTDDRIRSVRYWDQMLTRPVPPTYYELARWRAELRSFEALGAFRPGEHNLRPQGGQASPALGAEVTASTFGLLGAVPLMGRTIDRADERPGSAEVVVVGYDLWRGRLAGRPDVVGSTLDIGGVPHTVVGVMPEGFLFPARQQLWLPLREELVVEPARGRPLQVFGRLAAGASTEDAHTEVAASASRIAREHPEANQRLVGEVVRFGTSELTFGRGGWRSLNDHRILRVLALVLVVIAAGNVSMLVFAGTATRFRELAIRTSLGASRRRIISQMFVESLVLAVSAAGLGLVGFQILVTWVTDMLLRANLGSFPPYWLRFDVTAEMAIGALVVAVVSASIAGVLPALKVTGSKVQESIRKAEAGRSGIRFGGVTSALIAVDVAFAVGVVGLAGGMVGQVREVLDADARVGIPADEYLAAEVMLPELPPADSVARLALVQRTLVERLEAEPRVRGVGVADGLPRQDHAHRRSAIEGETSWLTSEGRPGAGSPPLLPVARVDLGFFDALGQPILAGRGFGEADLADSASTVIVNTSYVDRRLGGRNPIGQRIRFWVGNASAGTAQPEERWYEIVGVVGPLGINVANPAQDAGMYLPAAPGDINPLRLAIHVEGDPATFAPRLREIVAEVDATAVLQPPRVLGEVFGANYYFYIGSAAALAVIAGILIALAASGIYAIMSFAVSERTREIGIRRSLGERTSALALRIGRRSLAQIAIGVVLGLWPAMQLYRLSEFGYQAPSATFGLEVAVVAGVAVALVIGGLSCVSPTRRALSIEPAEALRS
jgi:predicted permease